VLVFIHELGHFLAAKACGIYVDQFSVGMPPRIFGFQWGETDYCIGALPIGGYVKMAGQEDKPLTEEERSEQYGSVPPERWFSNKPIWQRFIVLFAGPFMNLILAVVLYSVVAAMGGERPESEFSGRLGMISAESPAASAPLYPFEEGKALESYTDESQVAAHGWQTGDLVLAIDGDPVENFMDLAIAAILGGADVTHHVVIERVLPDNSIVRYVSPIQAALVEGAKMPRFGVAPFDSAYISDVMPDMPGAAAGLQPEDTIIGANGQWVDLSTFITMTEEVEEGDSMALKVLRDEQHLDIALKPATIGRLRGLVLGSTEKYERGEEDKIIPEVLGLTDEFKEATGLQRKDVIVEVNGQPATLALMEELERTMPGETLTVKVQRPSILFGLIQRASEEKLSLPVEPVRAVGVLLARKLIPHQLPPSEWIPSGIHESYVALERTLLTVKGLMSGNVSPKEIGGPLMIGSVASQEARAGLYRLLKITAFISINLFVMNLLPLPVLDGGQIVIHGLEGIRRKPLSVKFQEHFQMVGLVLIVGLMLFVTSNDILRWINNFRP
jgi:regulator of sigma E protease